IRMPSRNGLALCEPKGTRAYVVRRPPEMATTRASLVPHARMSPPRVVTLFTCVVSAGAGPPGRVGSDDRSRGIGRDHRVRPPHRARRGHRPEPPDGTAPLRDLAPPFVQRVVAEEVPRGEGLSDQVVFEDR